MERLSNGVKLFDNSITFFNPGKLFGDLTVQDLMTNNYQAYARNKLLAEAFYLTGDIEKYGSGFKRILNELKQYPTMNLECNEIPNGFLVTLNYITQKISSKLKVTDKVTDKVGDKVGDKLTDNQLKILENISLDPAITASELAKIINISTRKIEVNISKLKSKGLMVRIGPDKGGHWEIIENN